MEHSKLKITSKDFIGRQNEIQDILNLLTKTGGGLGNFLLIEGESGVGKTRLINELVNQVDQAKSQDISFLHGKCKYHQGLDPYSPFIEALRTWFGISEQTSSLKDKDEFKEKIGQHIRTVSPELISIIPLIRGFLSAGTSLYGSYLFKGSNIDKSFKTYTELIHEKKCGLFITRAHPDEMREQYNLINSEIYWLTKSTTDLPSLDPSQIEKIRWMIKDFVAEHKNCVVLLDGLEYLILQNNFENVLKFVELLKDDIALNDAVLILPIDPATLEDRQMALLERYMRVIISDKKDYSISKKFSAQIDSSILNSVQQERAISSFELDYEAEKDKMFEAILELLKNISLKKTLILFLDDLHWADRSSIQLLQYLFQNTVDNRILIIGCYRPEDIPDGSNNIQNLVENIKRLKLEDRLNIIVLDRLGKTETFLVVKNILNEDVPVNILNLIYKKTEGNPLYIEEIIKSLLESNIIDLDTKEWYTKFDETQIKIPNSISEVIKMRINRVVKGNDLIDQILKFTAVLGSSFNFEVLLESMKLHEELLLDNIENLIRVNIFNEVDEDRYKFDHTLIREVIYSNLGSRRKKILHARVGYSIENLFKDNLEDHYAELAHHFSYGGIIDKAIKYSIKEGEVSKELCAYDEALIHYRTALDMINSENSSILDKNQLINLYLNLGDLSLVLGAWGQAKEYFEKSLKFSKESGDDLKRVESRSKLGQIEIKRERWSLAINKLEEVLNFKLDEKKQSISLVAIKPKYIMRANISMIEILLKENLKGIYICINHPSHMIDRLLRTHKIPTQNIMYLDFITPMTGRLFDKAENAYIMDKEFSLDRLLYLMDENQQSNEEFIDLKLNNIDFIMVDNISNLITYTNQKKLEGFIVDLIDIIKKLTIVYGIVLIDNQTDPLIQDAIEKYFDNTITIKEEWL